jgi:ribosomal protein S18 acetylase RimI-like enzyme
MTPTASEIEPLVPASAAKEPAPCERAPDRRRVGGARRRPAENATTAARLLDESHARPHLGSRGREVAPAWHVRRLGPEDAAAFQALRLEGLARHPCAFAASHDEETGQSLADVAARLEHQPVFGGFNQGMLLGIAGFAVPARAKKRHKGLLWGVYVREAARGRGLGRALVVQVIEYARAHVMQLHAAVVTTNDAARGLYRTLGFTTYGLEPRGLACEGGYFDQELMVLRLDRASGGEAAERIREASF